MRRGASLPEPGGGYQLKWYGSQNEAGEIISAPIEVTSIVPMADRLHVEAEEMLADTIVGDDLNDRSITIDTNLLNFDLYPTYVTIFGAPTDQDVIDGVYLTVTVNEGVIVGSSTTSGIAFRVDSTPWPTGFPILIVINGRIEGAGGRGGDSASNSNGNGSAGFPGGTALYTRKAISLTTTNGELWGGGGGGGGSSAQPGGPPNTGGGGGGAGQSPGAGGAALLAGGTPGNPGTTEAGGAPGGFGGIGGGPGLSGSNGSPFSPFVGGAGAGPGAAIDGDSFVTDVGTVGDIRGPQVN